MKESIVLELVKCESVTEINKHADNGTQLYFRSPLQKGLYHPCDFREARTRWIVGRRGIYYLRNEYKQPEEGYVLRNVRLREEQEAVQD